MNSEQSRQYAQDLIDLDDEELAERLADLDAENTRLQMKPLGHHIRPQVEEVGRKQSLIRAEQQRRKDAA